MMRLLFAALLLLSSMTLGAEPIKYGISSMLSASNTFIHYEELNNYIAEKLGVESEIIHRESYSDMNQLLENQQVDFASICTGAMLYLKEGSYTIIAVPEIDGKSTYRSLIITNRSLGIQNISELAGKTFALTDRLSNTGYLFPTYYFSKNYSKPESFFSKIFYTGTHDKSIYLVNKGVVDAAAVDNLVFENLKSQNKKNTENIQVIHISPEFGIPPIVASNKMSAEDVSRLKTVLMNMHEDEKGKLILKDLMIDRFTPPSLEAYNNVLIMKNYVENNN